MILEKALKVKSDTTMIRISKETRDLVDANKQNGESQSDCIKRVFQIFNPHGQGLPPLDTYEPKFEGGFTLVGFREYSHDRNDSHILKNRQPDYVPRFEVLLEKKDKHVSIRAVTDDDLEKMKGSTDIYVEFKMNHPQSAFVTK